MINLSVEQQKKIEANKAAALLKKQLFNQKANSVTLPQKYQVVDGNSAGEVKTTQLKSQQFLNEKKQSTNNLAVNFTVISDSRFIADMCYHAQIIDIFKTIPGRLYDSSLRKWTFPLTEHASLKARLKEFNKDVVVNSVPDIIIKSLTRTDEPEQVDWSKIDKTLRDSLLPFQVEGVRFGIRKKGRCLIADDMGLGKTIQALGIASYFRKNWPLLIVCPKSMKFPWQEAIKTFLPNINPNVTLLVNGKDPVLEGDIVITSYELMKNCSNEIIKKKFGAVIFDESHFLKSIKSARTKVALQICKVANNVILLSGTPALSRPQELFSQIHAIDSHVFPNFYDFGIRYCEGKKDKFGWNFNGSSNLEELEVYLKKRIMIRRLKAEVLTELPSKLRKVVILHPNMVKSVSKQLMKIESEYASKKGADKHSTLLSYYSMTGSAKLNAVCEYIEDKLECQNKFLVFAHHTNVINGISELLEKKNIDYIKIDGSVSSEVRQGMCNKFQNENDCRVAVLSLKAANSGLTLTEAQLVIFAELYWNPGELIQAEDRAHRLGQQDSVVIEYLIAKGTADDHLWNLVQSKLNILNKVGLSKDNFKNTDTRCLEAPNQLTILSMFEKNIESKLEEGDQLLKGMEDDDIFDNINLEEIESQYCSSNKKMKIF